MVEFLIASFAHQLMDVCQVVYPVYLHHEGLICPCLHQSCILPMALGGCRMLHAACSCCDKACFPKTGPAT